MKKAIKTCIVILIGLLCQNCIQYKQNKGFVSPKSGESTIDFTTNKGVIVIPVEIEGTQKYFLFDNGDDLTTINRDKLKGRITKVSSANGNVVKLGQETVSLMKIGDFEFRKIRARNQNLSFIEKDVPNLGGLIGQSIISKANWLIDYPNKKLTIYKSKLSTNDFEQVPIKNIREPILELNYDGQKYSAFVDLGSSTAFSVTEGTDLANKLLKDYNFKANTREVATAGGLSTVTEQVAMVSNLKMGSLVFNNVYTSIRKSSSQNIRIGMEFFKNNKLYIDNTNGTYKVK